jgi:hypothetical protein
MTVQFVVPRSHSSTPLLDLAEAASSRAFTRFISPRISPTANPYSAPRRATWIAEALATSVFVGVHPVSTHVPPNLWRSIIATVCRRTQPSRQIYWTNVSTTTTKVRIRHKHGAARSLFLGRYQCIPNALLPIDSPEYLGSNHSVAADSIDERSTRAAMRRDYQPQRGLGLRAN